jgi:Flp pilus assembly protein TadG
MGNLRAHIEDQKGVVFILVVIILAVLVAFGALALDVGNALVVRNELQNVSDAAALAATRKLGSIYEGLSYAAQQAYVCDPNSIIPIAQEVGTNNRAGAKNITINADDVIIGKWNRSTNPPRIEPTLNQPDAVKVISRRDASANGPISTFFAGILGLNSTDVSAKATAALTAESTILPGNLIPVGIDEQWFLNKSQFCNQPIKFYPTGTPEGCAGWNTFFRSPASESYLRKTIMEGWVNGTYTSPEAEIGQFINFTGGTLGNNTFQAFQDLFNYMKTRDGDGNDSQWTASVIVYRNNNCSNPNQTIEIVGFATAVITAVVPPNVEITAKVICDNVETGRGSGGNYGTKGSIPGLVE